MRRLTSLVNLLLILFVLAACGGQPPVSTPTTTPVPVNTATENASSSDDPGVTDESATPTPEPSFSGEGPWTVTFEPADGVSLSGTLYGQGQQAVILAPMYPGEQAGWQSFAESLAGKGYRVLTFDFRGYGLSGGERSAADAPADLTAAIEFLRDHESDTFVLIGAGLGGLATIRVASGDGQVVGVVVLSSPRNFEGLEVSDTDLTALVTPSLWIATRNDMSQQAEEMFDLAGGADKQLWIYEGSSLPGTYIFEGADRADLERRLIEFAARVFGA